jgi:hypothetical protein
MQRSESNRPIYPLGDTRSGPACATSDTIQVVTRGASRDAGGRHASTPVRLIAAVSIAMSVLSWMQDARAQQPREDNRWGGMAHQPTEADVQQQERASGIAPLSQQQQRAADQDLLKMDQKLLRESAPATNAH